MVQKFWHRLLYVSKETLPDLHDLPKKQSLYSAMSIVQSFSDILQDRPCVYHIIHDISKNYHDKFAQLVFESSKYNTYYGM